MTTYALSAFRTSSDPAAQQLAGPNDSGQLVAGSEKLAQRFIIRLMTRKGSIPYATDIGSSFIDVLRMSGVFSEVDVFASFSIALMAMRKTMVAEELPTDPASERFSTAKLLRVAVTSNGLLLSIRVTSKAGGSVLSQLPVSFTLR